MQPIPPPAATEMSKEIPLQPNLFSGELEDTRTLQQKRADVRAARRAERQASLPPPLFAGRETIQFGVVKANPAHALRPSRNCYSIHHPIIEVMKRRQPRRSGRPKP